MFITCIWCCETIPDPKWEDANHVMCKCGHKTKVCVVCGEYFIAIQSRYIVCSDECSDKYYRGNKIPQKISCKVCKKMFDKRGNQKTCSLTCSKTHTNNQNKIKRLNYTRTKPFVSDIDYSTNLCICGVNTWNTPGFTKTLKNQVLERDGWRCYVCGSSSKLHVHHIIPRASGGRHDAKNLVTLCSGCHKSVESGNIEKAVNKCTARAMRETAIQLMTAQEG